MKSSRASIAGRRPALAGGKAPTGGFSSVFDAVSPASTLSNSARAALAADTGRDGKTGAGNKRGLPPKLRTRLEARSGRSMADVTVHYNSREPADVDAGAFTRGREIFLASGEEHLLGHEAWHVVQQMQGRVKGEHRLGRHAVNADPALEKEADVMAARMGYAPSSRTHDGPEPRGAEAGSEGTAPVGSTPVFAGGAPTQRGKKRKLEDTKKKPAPKPPAKRKKLKAKRKKPSAQAPAAKKVKPAPDLADLSAHQVQFGALQQGMISKHQGKLFAGPESMVGRRAPQSQRHVGVLALNRLTNFLKPPKPVKPPKKKKGEKKVKKKVKLTAAQKALGIGVNPIEVQDSMVAGHVFINTNVPVATQRLHEQVAASGSMADYLLSPMALEKPIDGDQERLDRQQAKLRKAIKQKRPHQKTGKGGKPPKGESALDLARQQLFLEAIAHPVAPTLIRPEDAGTFDDLLAQMELEHDTGVRKPTTPRVHMVMHPPAALPKEHAERVQSAFRKKRLAKFENPKTSLPPAGPKTPCLGCETEHRHQYSAFSQPARHSGAYFQGSSPVSRAAQPMAVKILKEKPAVGSVSQSGYFRNSDQPDSDSDEEGKKAPVLPRGFRGRAPKKLTWTTPDGDRKFPKSVKRAELLARLERARQRAARKAAKKAGGKKEAKF